MHKTHCLRTAVILAAALVVLPALPAAALYQFWIDLVAFQRSIAWFEDTMTPAAVDLFWQQLQAAIMAPSTAP